MLRLFISGFYLGEVLWRVQKAALKQRINLIVLKTASFDSYRLPIGLNHIDGILSILNVFDPSWVKDLCEA